MINLTGKIRISLRNKNGVARQKWLRFIGLTTIELIMVTLLALPFLETTSAHPALPGDLEHNPQVDDSAEFGQQIDTPQVDNGPQAAIPALQGSTSLTVSIESSPWAVKDSNGVPGAGDGDIPKVFVIEAAVTNEGVADATNVTIVLDYNPGGNWVLLSGEVPTRTVSTLGDGETTYAYWFAQYPQTNDDHQYTVTAEADNATLVSTSENKFEPDPSQTIEVFNTQGAGNQGLGETDVTVNNVGDVFTITQVYTTGTKPDTVALNPVGNDDFDPSVYRLVKVEGRTLDDLDSQLDTFADEVYITSLHTDTAKIEVTYSFVALLVRPARICSYAGVFKEPNDRKYDENYCSNDFNTIVTVDPGAQLDLSKTAEDLNGEPLVVGDIIRYTLQVTNTGTFTAFDVTVTDDLPDEVTCQSVTGGPGVCADPLIWNVGTLAEDQSEILLIDVKINEDAAGVDIVNSTTVTATNTVGPEPGPEVCPDGSEPVGGNCDETPDPATTLELTKTAEDADGEPLEVGDIVTYTLQVTNTDAFTAYNVVVTDDLPAEVTCQNVIGGPGACADPLVWNVGDLAPQGAPGDTATLLIEVVIDPEGEGVSIVNSATVTATNVFDPDPADPVCPDGTPPDTNGDCENVPGPNPDAPANKIFLPIVIKNS